MPVRTFLADDKIVISCGGKSTTVCPKRAGAFDADKNFAGSIDPSQAVYAATVW